jgi:hypothetical protein
MTITPLDVRNEYTATAGQTVFNYTFKIFSSTDLNVYITPAGQDADDATDITTAYTVDLGTIGDAAGGFITLDVGTSLNDLVTIVSNVPESRTTDYQVNGDFLPDTVNDDFDRVVQLTKQIEDTASRTLAFPQSLQNASSLTLPLPQATYFLRWKSDETGVENVDLTTFGGPTDSSVINYTAPFTGGTTRTQEDKNTELLSVKDFGAVGNGIADDSLAIQATIDALTVGGRVYFPPGTYRISVSIVVPSNVHLFGAGDSSIIQTLADFGDNPMIRNETLAPATTGARDTGIEVSHLKLDGNKANNSTGTEFAHCISFRAVAETKVHDVFCFEPKGDGIIFDKASGLSTNTSRSSAYNNFIEGCARQGIAMTSGNNMIVMGNTILNGDKHGIDLETGTGQNATDIVIANNVIVGNGDGAAQAGIAVQKDQGTQENVVVIGNVIRDQTGSGIVYRTTDGLVITGNMIDNPSQNGISQVDNSTPAGRISITNNVVQAPGNVGIVYNLSLNTVISDNLINDAGSNGIQINSSVGSSVTGNVIENSTGSGIEATDIVRVAISNNMCRNSTTSGIRFLNACIDNVVNGNVCNVNGAYGIDEGAGTADYNIITDNNVRGNTTAGMRELGSNSKIKDNLGWTTENSGTSAVANGTTSIVVAHGLDITPTLDMISIVGGENPTNDVGTIYVDSIGAANFTVNVENDPGASGFDFGWKVARP